MRTQWQLSALKHLFYASDDVLLKTEKYTPQDPHQPTQQKGACFYQNAFLQQSYTLVSAPRVEAGWRAWNAHCANDLQRHIVVNSLDEVIHYCQCDRRAFYYSVLFLDRFVALTGDCVRETCQKYASCLPEHRYPLEGAAQNCFGPKAIRALFLQVVIVCAMISCKIYNTYPPRISKVLLCINPSDRPSIQDFSMLEFLVCTTLKFEFHRAASPLVYLETLLALLGGEEQQSLSHIEKAEEVLFQYGDYSEEELREMQAAQRIHHARSRHHATYHPDGAADGGESGPWTAFGNIANLLSDLVVRGHCGASGENKENQRQAHGVPAPVMALAIVLYTAKLTATALPPVLLRVLPENLRGAFPCAEPRAVTYERHSACLLHYYAHLLEETQLGTPAAMNTALIEVENCFSAFKLKKRTSGRWSS
ncbi:hypothetical protein AGDE_12559 [Angomonas deanei]|nr:hypothetical protein AGDE_12559 [Angomonas deanei]|eukprot:EPY24032.1 hypothetical protein AGDE_12559 [Angomonas deanei]